MKIEIKQITLEQAQKKGIISWPIWSCDVSEFDWEYSENESCYLLEGEVEVVTPLNTVKFGEGDFVKFPKGLKCRWIVKQTVKKHYLFS